MSNKLNINKMWDINVRGVLIYYTILYKNKTSEIYAWEESARHLLFLSMVVEDDIAHSKAI